MTVPFQYEWLDELFRELATYIFFALTGYKFRPASANPYFTVNDDISPNDDDDDEMDVVYVIIIIILIFLIHLLLFKPFYFDYQYILF